MYLGKGLGVTPEVGTSKRLAGCKFFFHRSIQCLSILKPHSIQCKFKKFAVFESNRRGGPSCFCTPQTSTPKLQTCLGGAHPKPPLHPRPPLGYPPNRSEVSDPPLEFGWISEPLSKIGRRPKKGCFRPNLNFFEFPPKLFLKNNISDNL